MTTEQFLALCKSNGLSIAELDNLNIGRTIDYLYDYTDILKQRYGTGDQENQSNERQASQADFDSF